MPQFSKRSEDKLATCDARLQAILREAIKRVDFSVLCGFRDEDDQNEAFRTGNSTKRWPHSKHNSLPSTAVDVAPYPVNWHDPAAFARLAGYLERIAHELGVAIKWGGDFNADGRTADEKFIDMPHIELIGP